MDIEQILTELTLEEKAMLLQGKSSWTTFPIPRLGIPSIFLSDGPHGLRKQVGSEDQLGLNASLPATCFPTAAAMANSWDAELEEQLGRALGAEAAASDVQVVLGPGLNIKRSPLCGRNFEYFSEDPYLAGKMAAACIRGIQANGTAACPKHFAANSQELRRMSADSIVDERTLQEIYLTGFEIAVKEGHPHCIMTSYNPVNGTYANEHPYLLGLLRQWGFDGFVMTDWGGSNNHTEGVRAGSALMMPGPGLDAAVQLAADVRNGILPERALDDRLREMLPVVFSTRQAAPPQTASSEEHHNLARKCATESIVLLENDGILPLCAGTKAALIGDFAKTPRYQGAGSSKVNPSRLDTLLDLFSQSGLLLTGHAGTDAVEEAVLLARQSDVVLLCLGLDDTTEAEGFDRRQLSLPEAQYTLARAVAQANPNVILLLSGGAPFLLPESGFRAAVHGYLGGQAGAGAMLDVITGRANPSGKLAETWPLRLEDTPCCQYYPGMERTCEYREGLYVGYRYYDTAGIPVRYPFGYGLSYTRFSYSDLQSDGASVSFTLTNTGTTDGAEIAQLYVHCRDSRIFRPKKELKGFRKVFLKAGECRQITIALDDKAWRYFNPKTGRWEIESGSYDLLIGASVSDIRLQTTLQIHGSDAPLPYGHLPSYESGHISSVPDDEWETLLGRPRPEAHWDRTLQRNDTVSQLYYAKSAFARFVHRVLSRYIEKHPMDLNVIYSYNMPLRCLAHFSGGHLTQAMVDDLTYLCNGHFFRGFGRMLRSYLRSRGDIHRFRKNLPKS